MLNSENRLVTYVNKKGERMTLPLNMALESNNAEMTKRLKYTKDILTHMLNNNGTSNPSSSGRAQTGASSRRAGEPGMGLMSATASDRRPLNVLNNQP